MWGFEPWTYWPNLHFVMLCNVILHLPQGQNCFVHVYSITSLPVISVIRVAQDIFFTGRYLFMNEWISQLTIKYVIFNNLTHYFFVCTRQRCPLPATNKRFLRNVLVSTLEPRKKKPKQAGIIKTQELCMTISLQNNFLNVAGHIDRLKELSKHTMQVHMHLKCMLRV